MKDRLPRKLAGILYADVAGYSRLTGEDEEGTHRRLSEYLDLISDAIEEHQGRVVHYAGDAVLADFDTVTEALSCSTGIQRALASRSRDLPDERKVQLRIGVNLGEVIVDRDDIYGDGVNVAARLEGLAEPSGICISVSVRTAVSKKLDLIYEFMGEQKVKNIEEPVRAYRVLMEWAERYDRSLAAIFELQDEMTQTIVGAVEPELSAAERERAARRPPGSLDAWEIYQRGLWHLWSFTKDDEAEAQRLFRRVHELDPAFATAYAFESYSH